MYQRKQPTAENAYCPRTKTSKNKSSCDKFGGRTYVCVCRMKNKGEESMGGFKYLKRIKEADQMTCFEFIEVCNAIIIIIIIFIF